MIYSGNIFNSFYLLAESVGANKYGKVGEKYGGITYVENMEEYEGICGKYVGNMKKYADILNLAASI